MLEDASVGDELLKTFEKKDWCDSLLELSSKTYAWICARDCNTKLSRYQLRPLGWLGTNIFDCCSFSFTNHSVSPAFVQQILAEKARFEWCWNSPEIQFSVRRTSRITRSTHNHWVVHHTQNLVCWISLLLKWLPLGTDFGPFQQQPVHDCLSEAEGLQWASGRVIGDLQRGLRASHTVQHLDV